MKELKATIKLTTEKAIEGATANFDNLNGDLLTLVFRWTNKNTTVESFEKYTKKYLNSFSSMKGSFEIKNLELIEK